MNIQPYNQSYTSHLFTIKNIIFNVTNLFIDIIDAIPSSSIQFQKLNLLWGPYNKSLGFLVNSRLTEAQQLKQSHSILKYMKLFNQCFPKIHFPALNYVDLSHTHISSFAGLENCESIKSLNCSFSNWKNTSQELSPLPPLPSLPNLKELKLLTNLIPKETALSIKSFTKLEYLNIGYFGYIEEEPKELKKILKCLKLLKELHIGFNKKEFKPKTVHKYCEQIQSIHYSDCVVVFKKTKKQIFSSASYEILPPTSYDTMSYGLIDRMTIYEILKDQPTKTWLLYIDPQFNQLYAMIKTETSFLTKSIPSNTPLTSLFKTFEEEYFFPPSLEKDLQTINY